MTLPSSSLQGVSPLAKELIRKVTLENGESVPIYMPTIGEYLDLTAAGKTPIEAMVTSSLDMSFQEFKKLSVIDGSIIIGVITQTLASVEAYMNSQNQDNRKK